MSSTMATRPLSEVANINSETLSTATPPGFRFRYIDLSAVSHGNIDWNATDELSYATAPSRARRVVRSGDVLYGTVRPGNLSHSTMPKQTMSDAVIASTGFAVLRPKPGVADSSFLGHWCFSLLAQEDARRAEVGSNYPAVNESDLNRFRFPAMPVSEQRRIAEILDTLDDQIRLTEASLQKRREVRIGLIRDLLQGAYDSGSVTTIGDLAEHVGSGATPRGGSDVYQRSGVLFIRSQNVHFEGLVLDDVAYISEAINSLMARSEVFANDVLINITGASIGRCCVMPPGLGKANVNQHVCAIRLPHCSWVDATYLSEVLASHWGQHQVDLLNAGGNREGLNYQQLRAFKVAWPSQEERQFAVRAINCMDKALWPLKRQVDSLRALKAGLMADLLSGWVRVPEGVV